MSSPSEIGAAALKESGRLSGVQLGVLVSGFVALSLVLAANFIARDRRRASQRETKSARVTGCFLSLRDLARPARDLLLTEVRRERSAARSPGWPAACGWGAPGGPHARVHFKRAVADSLRLVEAAATRRDATLAVVRAEGADAAGLPRTSGAVDVEEYLMRLRRKFPALDADLSRRYVSWYRRSRAQGREISEREYEAFLRVLKEVRRRIDPERYSGAGAAGREM